MRSVVACETPLAEAERGEGTGWVAPLMSSASRSLRARLAPPLLRCATHPAPSLYSTEFFKRHPLRSY